MFGFIYLVVTLGLGIISTEIESEAFSDLLIIISLLSCVASIVHAFIKRKEYLVRREVIVDKHVSKIAQMRSKIYNEMNALERPQPATPVLTNVSQTFIPDYAQPPIQETSTQQDDTIIDINTCTEQEYLKLPGMGLAKAKKAIGLRSQIGGFTSFDDFVAALDIEPHFAVQIESKIIISQFKKPEQSFERGRTVDI